MEHPHVHIIKGSSPILLSAPHTVDMLIDKKGEMYLKPRETRVAEIVKTLCAEKSAWGMFTETAGPIPNWRQGTYKAYKQIARNIIETNDIGLCIDFHGSRESRPFLIDYDFIIPERHPYDSILENLINLHYQKHFGMGLSNGFFRTIKGPGKRTLTYHVRKHTSIPAVQIEINRTVRTEDNTYEKFLDLMRSIMQDYENITSGIQQENQVLHN